MMCDWYWCFLEKRRYGCALYSSQMWPLGISQGFLTKGELFLQVVAQYICYRNIKPDGESSSRTNWFPKRYSLISLEWRILLHWACEFYILHYPFLLIVYFLYIYIFILRWADIVHVVAHHFSYFVYSYA